MKSESTTRRFTADELRARRGRGEGQSDLARVRAKSEAELERDIAGDADSRDVPRDWYKTAEGVMPKSKVLLSLRLDESVVEWFKSAGPGYQTRMNAALIAFMRASQKRRV